MLVFDNKINKTLKAPLTIKVQSGRFAVLRQIGTAVAGTVSLSVKGGRVRWLVFHQKEAIQGAPEEAGQLRQVVQQQLKGGRHQLGARSRRRRQR